MSETIEGDSAQWTTSCMICDLNQDGMPDLYSVNYLSGDIRTRICRDPSGVKASCAPQAFPASQDQLHLNTGDGRFVDVTESSGIAMPDGKGLGIVAVDFNSDQRLDLFVANDGVANFYFENVTTTKADTPRFVESALLNGMALNHEGRSEACMGIAAEDFDLDGQMDLFVTNFLDETNTLYHRSAEPVFFDDATWRSGLGAAGLRMLGFGTQAIDGELDGLPGSDGHERARR